MKVLRLPARQRLVKLYDPLYAYFGAILITFSNDFTSYFQCGDWRVRRSQMKV